jgi:hypothetical protein
LRKRCTGSIEGRFVDAPGESRGAEHGLRFMTLDEKRHQEAFRSAEL